MKKLILSAVFGVAMCGCIDLEVDPPKNIAAETFWKTEKDAWYGLNACYDYLPGVGVYDDAYVDNVYCPYPWESSASTFQIDGLSSTNDEGYSFTGVRMTNNFIQKVKHVSMDESTKTRMVAEARFIRAMRYMDLTLTFGKVPFITDVLNYDAPNVKRESADSIRKFVLTELSEVAQILPERYTGGYLHEKGRITKGAAFALQARAALYFGDMKTAEAAADSVMKSNLYSLFTVSSLNENQQKEADEMDIYVDFDQLGINKDKFMKGMFSYEALWHTENGNPDNPEYILTRQYMPGNADYADLTRYTSMRPDQLVVGWSSIVPMQDLVDAYWDAKGEVIPQAPEVADRAEAYKAIRADFDTYMAEDNKHTMRTYVAEKKSTFKNVEYMKEFRNRDSRMYASILFPFKGWYETDAGTDFAYEWKKGSGNESVSGYNFRKLVTLNSTTMLWETYPMAEGDYPVIRYAEILLTYAEARTRNTGWDGQVAAAINLLRDRCGMPHVTTPADPIEFIRNERRIELAGEGQRLQDIRRMDTADAKRFMETTTYKPDGEALISKKWSERMHLMPIPQTAIDLNPLLKGDQNLGY